MRERWQPVRCGIINLYRFDAEEFHFHRGRLMLRGNNGTGKSRVLALTLPFLLDGEVALHRLEPDGDPAKRAEWNLLMGQLEDRLGYTWIEFGRRTPEGEQRWLTLGCGLSATKGKPGVTRWFFITRMRVGHELFLMTPSRTPLKKDRLVEALAERGTVYNNARDYRRAVDAELFQMGPDRYSAFVDLLIGLRQPQLSRSLDERGLDRTLSQALPRIPDGVLGEVAEAFRSLENDRRTLSELSETRTGLERFLSRYGHYLKVATRRRTVAVREAQSRYENCQRRLRESGEELQATQKRQAELTAETRALEQQDAALEEAIRVLQQSPEMRSARALDEARQAVEKGKLELSRCQEETRQAAGQRQALEESELQARQHVATQTEAARQAREALQAMLLQVGLPEEADQRALEDRRRQAELVLQRNRELEKAEAALAQARRSQEERQSDLERIQERQREAHSELRQAARALGQAVETWMAGLKELKLEPEVLEELLEWAEDPEAEADSEPLTPALSQASESASRPLLEQVQELRGLLKSSQERRAELEQERSRLQEGRHIPPPLAPTRERSQPRAGAPLYLLCDFAPDVSPAEQAGLEAALEGAGLLDAWVTPEGGLLPAGERDAVLVAGRSPRPERHLGERLRPCQGPVPTAVVEALLEHIGLESGAVWVSGDGSWQLGPLHGRWSRERAEHIGEGAREALRRKRLEELARELEELAQRAEALRGNLADVEARQLQLKREASSVPSREGVNAARAAIREVERQVDAARARLADAERVSEERRQAADERRQQRDRDARDTGLTSWVERLEELKELLRECQTAWEKARLFHDFALRAEDAARRAAEQLAGSRATEQARLERQSQAEREQVEASARLRTLEETVGQAVEAVLQRLAQARQERTRVHSERARLGEESKGLERQLGRLESEVRQAQEDLSSATDTRQTSVESFSGLASKGVLKLVTPTISSLDLDRSLTRAVEVAREVDQALGSVDCGEEAWKRAQGPVYNHFEQLKSDLPSQDYRPEACTEQELFMVYVLHQGQRLALNAVLESLTAELEQRQRLLTAREREVIENHLLSEIAEHLHQLLFRAEMWVDQVNEELMQRPTSSGMRFKFRWLARADGPTGLEDARRRLMRASATWSREEREQVGEFLQRQIEDARKLTPEGGWVEHLTVGLDYRSWHQFQVHREQNGVWTRLTKRTHGTGSGGEKAFALTVPQFAAAAAYYKSACPEAPRLILLDEAFVGVDAKMRGQCMGMLEAFDLDFIMTSEREWGNFAELRGAAIYQMSARPGIDAVHSSRWVWNGSRLALEPVESTPLFAEAAV